MIDPEKLIDQVVRDEVRVLMGTSGMTPREAEECALGMAKRAWERASERTNDPCGQGQGDILLARETSDPNIHRAFEKRRAEGVTDADIRWWWNMSAFEQEHLEEQDGFNRMTLYTSLRVEQGLDRETVVKEVFRRHAKYGDPEEGEGDDRPLPYEMKGRVTAFLEKHQRADPQAFIRRLHASSSLNAIIREEIRAGRL